MKRIAPRFVQFGIALSGLVVMGWVLTGEAAKPAAHRVSLPTDWTHRHLIFSHPGSAAQTRRVNDEPRYWQQLERQRQRVVAPARMELSSAAELLASKIVRRRRMHRDWSVNLGSGGTGLVGNFPAEFSSDTTIADCTNDYVIFSTGLAGAATQASIVAFNNLYAGCGGTVPSVRWAYNTSQLVPAVPGTIKTSPALSLDGKQIAFVQTNGAGAGTLVLLKWAASAIQSVGSPGTPLQVPALAYPACVAPCMTKFNLADRSPVFTDDTTSSVFYDYGADIAWVGDSRGLLHRFTGVFKGTPAETSDATWPLQVSAGLAIGSPVHDFGSGNIFVNGVGDGFLYRVDPTNGTVTASGQLDHGVGLVASPIVDSTNQLVYVSASRDNSAACALGADCAAVYQFATGFGAGTFGSKVAVGNSTILGNNPQPMFNGFFDSDYFNSVDATGHYYVCGNTGGTPTLYQVPIQAGVLGTPTEVSILTKTQTQPCSQVTDFANPNTAGGPSERVFVSVAADAWPRECSTAPVAGCLISFVVTQWKPNTAYNVGQQVLVSSPGNPAVLFTYTVTDAGTSGPTTPAWLAIPDRTTPDPNFAAGSVAWLNQGRIDDVPYALWLPNQPFNVVGQRIIDSNGNAQLVHLAGTSAAAPPVWATVPGALTTDGTMTWRCGGPVPTAALPASGGTTGIIIDNVVPPGTLAGASQVYFSTLADQPCGSGGTGHCAVQASQQGLN